MGVTCFLVEPVFRAEVLPASEVRNTWPSWPKQDYPPGTEIKCFRRVDTAEEKEDWCDFGPGAMVYAIWYEKCMYWTNETEPHLLVACPDMHVWDIDSRAANCTLKENTTHRCWIRNGTPPLLTVNKLGATCAAGGGSIRTSTYHGLLINGVFVDC